MGPDPKLLAIYQAGNIKLGKTQWDSWKASLHSVGQHHALHPKTKILAKQALDKMKDIEARNAENDKRFADKGTKISKG